MKSVQSLLTKSHDAYFPPPSFFFFLTIKASVTLDVDFQGRNSSNSSRYDCNPVSTAVTQSSVQLLGWQKCATLAKEIRCWNESVSESRNENPSLKHKHKKMSPRSCIAYTTAVIVTGDKWDKCSLLNLKMLLVRLDYSWWAACFFVCLLRPFSWLTSSHL